MSSFGMAASPQIEGSSVQSVEQDMQRLLIPVQPPSAFREHLHQVLIAAASGTKREVHLRHRRRVRAWLLSASGVVLAVLVTLRSVRVFRRPR